MLDRITNEVMQGSIFKILPDDIQEQISLLTREQVQEGARGIIVRPQPGDASQAGRLLLNPCLAVSWLGVFEELNLPKPLKIFEPCAGSSEPIILASEIYTNGEADYTTVNLNRPLAEELKAKLSKLKMRIQIIEDDVSRADIKFAVEGADIACFHHAINDILQTSVSEPRGMNTRTVDWWPNERQMIEWLAADIEAGKIDEYAKPALLQAVKHAVRLVKPGGYLVFDHWTWEGHRKLDWFPWELYCNLIPMAREWIHGAGLPIKERSLSGRDPQWWMCFQKES
jgi:SAM-dependent methyltransferase